MVCSRYPKECLYYESVLKRKCLRKFKNNVWENKVKWKLVEKAEFHLRGKLLYKYFNLWLHFLNESCKKKINRRAAESLYEEKLKSKGIRGLKRNAEQCWMLLRVCRKKYEWNLKFKSWHQWKHYTQKRSKVREIKLLANKIREERLRMRFFYLWLFRLKESRSLEKACRTATTEYEIKLKRKYFNSWKIFRKKRICKRKIDSLSVECYRDRLIEKVFHSWKKHTSRKNRYRTILNIIQTFHENYLVESYLTLWLKIYQRMKFERDMFNYSLAVNLHSRKLLERSFRIWWKIIENAKERKGKMAEFERRLANVYLKHYLDLWMERKSVKVAYESLKNKAMEWRENYLMELLLSKLIEKREERREEREDMNKVERYSNAIILHRAFRGWLEISVRHRNRRIQTENAFEFYFEKILKKSFGKWKDYWFLRRRKKMADDYHKNLLLAGALDRWKIFVSERRTKLMEARILEKKHDLRIMKNAFSLWKNQLDVFKDSLMIAIDFYNKSRISKAFHTWRKNAQMKTVNKNSYNRKSLFVKSLIIRQVIFRWHEIYSGKRQLDKKIKELKGRQEKRLVGSRFRCWRRLVDKMNALRQAGRLFPQLRSSLLLEQYMAALLDAVKRERVFKRKEELAGRTADKLLGRKYLRKWRSFVFWKRERILRVSGRRPPEEVFPSRGYFDLSLSVRRKPLVPSYLRHRFNFDLEEEVLLNEETHRADLSHDCLLSDGNELNEAHADLI